MKKGDLRRQQLLEQLADYVLAYGLQETSLRTIASSLGTSDRMLLHYFVTKEELLTATLTRISERLMVVLDSAKVEQLPFPRLLPHLAQMIASPLIQPYLTLWLELASLAARQREPFQRVAQEISTSFLHWISATLAVGEEEERAPMAALTLAMIEGLVLLDALGDESMRTRALAGFIHWNHYQK